MIKKEQVPTENLEALEIKVEKWQKTENKMQLPIHVKDTKILNPGGKNQFHKRSKRREI